VRASLPVAEQQQGVDASNFPSFARLAMSIPTQFAPKWLKSS
jgi:hypothetical protein